MEMPEEIFDKVVKIAQARGFVFNASSIYGGLRSSYDYGPLGVLLKIIFQACGGVVSTTLMLKSIQ